MRRMSEDEIERWVERMVDALDRRFMNGKMDQAQYDAEMAKIDAWSKAAWVTALAHRFAERKADS